MREGLRDFDVRLLAALVRGGATYEEAAAAAFADVNPEVLAAWRAHVLDLSNEPGPSASIAPPRTFEDDREAMRRFFKAPSPIVVKRAYRGGR